MTFKLLWSVNLLMETNVVTLQGNYQLPCKSKIFWQIMNHTLSYIGQQILWKGEEILLALAQIHSVTNCGKFHFELRV